MSTFHGKIERPVTIDADDELDGMITEDATVLPGGTFRLRGMVCKDLIIHRGARAVVDGMVIGRVINEGSVEVHGIVGDLVERPGSSALVSPTALIRSRAGL